VEAGAHWFQMIGREVRDYVAKNVPPLLDEVLSASGLTVDAVDHFVPHQANGLMLDDLADRVGLAGRLRTTVAEYGNTGAASVPITLDRTVRRGEVRPGQLVLLTAFGGGMAMAAATVRWAG
jgi:3-oxoacyl-[acyl-carrier-protein] synthase-3